MRIRLLWLGTAIATVAAGAALAGSTPVNTGTPDITATPRVGSTLTCLKGAWMGADSFTFAWLRDGVRIAGATRPLYTAKAADRRHALVCQVLAQNPAGGTVAQSRPVAIDPVMGIAVTARGRQATLKLSCPTGTEGCSPTRITIRHGKRVVFRGPVQAVNEGTTSVTVRLTASVRRRSTVAVAIQWTRDDGGPAVRQGPTNVTVR